MRNIPTRRFAALLLAAVLMPVVSTLACQVPDAAPITPFDGDRMTGFEAARSRGLAEALLSDNAADRALVSTLFALGETPISQMPDGNYRCRTIKLGGLLPLTTYTQFACTVSNDGARIEKLTGSQRFSGNLLPSDGGGLFYWGTLHYGDEAPMNYRADPERSQVGCVYKVDGKPVRYRLELPFPRFESTHDVIELVPTR
ncbi:DUF4893 domain-containing protein [Devosia marina]|uniref:DUF4893 domain-containing protein n=1 Tax=Devosia marina TaxID=2683198 RepID=A0A7X3FR28_9HYPH|nr:DUF4893 domain-containing protein [Devosia marina]MVS99204.1 DUF4893 domain-containing protein [Devosia marina]